MVETCGRRRLSRLARARLGRKRPLGLEGRENLPGSGSFVLAINHYGGCPALDLLAVVMAAVSLSRPDVAERYLMIVGRRAPTRPEPAPLPARLVRRLVDLVYSRWAAHAARIPLGNQVVSIHALRKWRARAREQPVLVFPEGKTSLCLGAIRPGAGRWLGAMGTPVIPLAVWWYRGEWRLRAGKPVVWAYRRELHDVQLGLSMAELLPPELAPDWQPLLERWREAHEGPSSEG